MAAIITTVSSEAKNRPPRKSRTSAAPLGVTRYNRQHSKLNDPSAISAIASNAHPLSRNGPRITANGRQSMANAAPSRTPDAREKVPM